MKKTILILVVLALLVPAAAMAATEFSLGGFIKLESFWDSSQQGKNMNTAIPRNNDQLGQHGRFNMTAQGSRFNFTIKGPKLWGATSTGFIEMDFDPTFPTGGNDNAIGASHAYIPRLRIAMFRLNWAETELMFGQYHCFEAEFAPETTQDGGFQFHGQPTHRAGQIRLTQKFAGAWTVAGMIAQPTDPGAVDANFLQGQTVNTPVGQVASLGLDGQSSETPQLQAKVAYEQDLWGKAPFYGRPRGFTAQVMGGWQRTRYRSGSVGALTFGQNQFGAQGVIQRDQQYLDPWLVQADFFIPVLPTYSNNLAGSASLTAQWYVGQGLAAFGNGRDQDQSSFTFKGVGLNNNLFQSLYDRELTHQWGGYVQGQYWFTNQWFLNLAWGYGRNFGQDTGHSGALAAFNQQNNPVGNPTGYRYASTNDQVKTWQEIDATLWYRPIAQVKFGLQYSYGRTDYLQKINNPNNVAQLVNGLPLQAQGSPASGATNVGEAHRIEFVAFLFF